MTQLLMNEQHFVGTSLHQHPSSCDYILVFNGRFDFEQKKEIRWDLGISELNLGFRDLRFNLGILIFDLGPKWPFSTFTLVPVTFHAHCQPKIFVTSSINKSF